LLHGIVGRVIALVLTDEARALLDRLRGERNGSLTMVIGNGCCDSTAPFVFESYLTGPNEARIAELDGVEVVLDRALLDLFDGREVVIDAGPEPAGDSFSCEADLGMRFSIERMPRV
jgi:uncharacterized protein (DUF779 family)